MTSKQQREEFCVKELRQLQQMTREQLEIEAMDNAMATCLERGDSVQAEAGEFWTVLKPGEKRLLRNQAAMP
jgi:hypothetical protein